MPSPEVSTVQNHHYGETWVRTHRFSRILVAIVVIPRLALIILLATATFAGCSSGSAGGTLPSGRSVMTKSDVMTLKSQLKSDTATVETAGMQIVVKPTSLIVDGNTVAEIDSDVSDVKVNVKDGVVTFVADGKAVTTTH